MYYSKRYIAITPLQNTQNPLSLLTHLVTFVIYSCKNFFKKFKHLLYFSVLLLVTGSLLSHLVDSAF